MIIGKFPGIKEKKRGGGEVRSKWSNFFLWLIHEIQLFSVFGCINNFYNNSSVQKQTHECTLQTIWHNERSPTIPGVGKDKEIKNGDVYE